MLLKLYQLGQWLLNGKSHISALFAIRKIQGMVVMFTIKKCTSKVLYTLQLFAGQHKWAE